MTKFLRTAALAALAFSAASANAAVVFDNGVNLEQTGAYFSQGGFGPIADDFTLANAATIRSAEFWGVHWSGGTPPADSAFTAKIYEDNGSGYGALVGTTALTLVSRTDTGQDHNEYGPADILKYVVDFVAPISLSANTSYFFELLHVTSDNSNQWGWQRVNGEARSAVGGGAGGYGDTSFNLSDSFAGAEDVPEPAMLGLFGLGAIGLGLSRRRRA